MTSSFLFSAEDKFSPNVLPVQVITDVSSKLSFVNSFKTAYTPPASFKSSMYVGPAGARWQRLGVFSLISFAISKLNSTPHSLAIAGRCNILLVEHPKAISAVKAFFIDCFVIISRGQIFFFTSSIICIPACFASSILAEYTAGIVPLPLSPIPKTSVKQFIEFAVYIPEQEPHVGQVFSS